MFLEKWVFFFSLFFRDQNLDEFGFWEMMNSMRQIHSEKQPRREHFIHVQGLFLGSPYTSETSSSKTFTRIDIEIL